MRYLKVIIGLISLAVVLAVAWWESAELTSPGPLHPSHAQVKTLRRRGGCVACHGDEQVTMAQACLVCHEVIQAQMQTAAGLHGALDAEQAAACAQCHVEHADGAVPLVAAGSFRAVGVAQPERYDHGHVASFALTGRHPQLACARCHVSAQVGSLAAGERRFLGLHQQCVACHKDTHDGSYGPDCASCHGQAHPFDEAAAFKHDPAFALSGGHAHLACKQCHRPDTPRSIAALRRASSWSVRACAACHQTEHREAFLREVAALMDGATATCAVCHDAVHAGFRRPAARMPVDLHRASGFSLTPPHDRQACSACHAGADAEEPLSAEPALPIRFAVRFPGRLPQDCAACHADPHAGQFDAGPTRGRCIACHEATHFFPAQFDAEMHSDTGFPLTGAHQAVGCRSCHGEKDAVRRFVPTPTECAVCHTDVHLGRFDSPDRPAPVGGNTGCARCHVTESFKTVRWSADVHASWTGYALEGAHAEAACTACHKPVRDGTAGSLTFAQAPTTCASCHADPHAGQFREAGVTDCARCHTDTRSFTRLVFDHQTDARFTLDGKHRGVACAACHMPVQTRDGQAVVRYRPLGRTCQDCHGFKTVAGTEAA